MRTKTDARTPRRRRPGPARDAPPPGVTRMGTWEWEIVSGAIRWSDGVYETLGVPRGTPDLMEAFRSSLHPEDRDRVMAGGVAARAGAAPPRLVLYRIVHPDDGIRIVEQRTERVGAGAEARLTGSLQDVTDVTDWRGSSEGASVFANALEQTADAAFITDRDGLILYVNDAFVRQSGYAREEALGRTPRLLKSGVQGEGFYRDFWRCILSGASWHGTFVNRRRDGSLFHEEKTVTPIRASDGEITHFISTGRDITERRRAEEGRDRLQQMVTRSAQEWRATFDAVDSPMLILDAEGRVRRPNRAARELAGVPYATLLGMKAADVGPGPLWSAIAEAVAAVVTGGRPVSLQVKDERAGRTWDLGASPLTEAGVDDGAVIVLARDVSPIVALQDSLRRGEAMSAMGRLVAGVAHEVRNPLFGISATLDAFDAEFAGSAPHREYSALLRSEVSRLSHLMQDLLEYGRPAPAQRVRGPLGPILERGAQACAALSEEAGAHVRLDVAAGLPEADVDPARFVQVVQNLVANAIQHSRRGDLVVLSATLRPGGRVEIAVEDEGPGFRPEDLAHLFEPFYTRRRGGTGLGLSIVHRIVSEHGGDVQAANRPGGGAVVTVRLPPAAGLAGSR